VTQSRHQSGQFLKGHHQSPDTEFKKGMKLSEETKQKMKGRIPWNKGLKGYNSGEKNPFFGKHHTIESKDKNRISHKGKKPTQQQLECLSRGRASFKGRKAPWAKNNPHLFKPGFKHINWKGGVRCWRGTEWRSLAKEIRKRDNYMCVDCGSCKNLSVHHIIPYRITKDNSFDNLETLCRSCHAKKDFFYNQYGCVELEPYRDFIAINGQTIYVDAERPEEAKKLIESIINLRVFAQREMDKAIGQQVSGQ